MALTATPDGAWSLADPCTRLPAPLPEPTAGVNFAREGMHPTDWAVLVSREGQVVGGGGGGEGVTSPGEAAGRGGGVEGRVGRARGRARGDTKKKDAPLSLLGSTSRAPHPPLRASQVAVHSDAWLTKVAFFHAAAKPLDAAERAELFRRMNELPTLLEEVGGWVEKKGGGGQGGGGGRDQGGGGGEGGGAVWRCASLPRRPVCAARRALPCLLLA